MTLSAVTVSFSASFNGGEKVELMSRCRSHVVTFKAVLSVSRYQSVLTQSDVNFLH